MDKPILSKQAFWDVDMNSIDYEKHAVLVMETIIKWGSFDDFLSLTKYYGEERWKREIINSQNLDSKEANFCCLIFKLNMQDFIYPIKPFKPQPWELYSA
ncbi:hypothetical protein ABIB62_003453 [Mucilaginibacter sp. UYP25]|uniref:DUF6922 domain-containing protein n=1 Tax=unclassified Mucilaginibacter TaxID=2617802 RepID=UPI0033933386